MRPRVGTDLDAGHDNKRIDMKVSRFATALVACASSISLAHAADPAPAPAAHPAATARPALPNIDIAFQKFVLPNGLTLVIHEDHKAPVVAVNVWYHIG